MPDDKRSGLPAPADVPARDRQLAIIAAAVRSTAAVRGLARDLAMQGVRLMILRGPPVQLRLLGSDNAYQSADVDVLIAAAHRRTAFRVLTASGWRFSSDNGVLWRIDGAAAFTRQGITVDLHWGLHAHSVSARHLRPLERALWQGAHLAPDGWYEPRPEPLLVYLAIHGAASAFHKPSALTLIRAADEQARDRAAVDVVARDAHVRTALEHALRVAAGERSVDPAPAKVFDGPVRRLISAGSRRGRAFLTVAAVRQVVVAMRGRRHPPV